MHDGMLEALKKKGIHLTITVDGEKHEAEPEAEVEASPEEEEELDMSSDMSESDKKTLMGKEKTSLVEKVKKAALMKKMGEKKV